MRNMKHLNRKTARNKIHKMAFKFAHGEHIVKQLPEAAAVGADAATGTMIPLLRICAVY